MKNSILILLIALTACTNLKDNQFRIIGEISGNAPSKVYLKVIENRNAVIVDSAECKNGKFTFNGDTKLPEVYYIQLGDGDNDIRFFNEQAIIHITADAEHPDSATITGSKTNDQYEQYLALIKPIEDEMEGYYNEYKIARTNGNLDLANQKMSLVDSLDYVETESIKKYVSENTNSVIAPYLISTRLIYYLDLDELEPMTNSLDPMLKESKYSKVLWDRIEVLRKLQPGMPAPDFTQNDTLGNPVNLSDYKGKYLLIDFWASWCGPCRRANPTVVAMYKKYHRMGFNILGVSMDKDKDKWMGAIKQDGLAWAQVSTLEGWNNPVGKLYGVNSIPHSILIGSDGIIVKRGIEAKDLDVVLGNLLIKK